MRLVAAVLLSLCALAVRAQEFPTRPIKLIVPFAPGGSTDIIARHLVNGLAAELGQPVTIDNRGGANGIVGAQAAAASPADGYTLFLAASSVMSVNPVVHAKLPYDPLKSFAPVSLLSTQPLVLAVAAGVAATNLQELMALAKARPETLNFGDTGSSTTLPLLHLLHLAGAKVQEVPYKGAGPALVALIAGHIQIMPITIGTVYPQVSAGKVRALAVTSARRAALLPDVPTVAEAGYPGYAAIVWNGLAVPAGVPEPIIERINQATVKVLSSPELRAQLVREGLEVVPSSAREFGEFIRKELVHWQTVARDIGGVKLQ